MTALARRCARLAAGLTLALSFLGVVAAPAFASVPNKVSIEGLLQSSGGGAAADGAYKIVFALYKDAAGGAPIWTETADPVGVKGGTFAYLLGTATPLDPTVLANLPAVYLGLAVGSDPELPRKPLSSVPFSMRAGLAEGLDCTGCVALGQLDPKILAGYAKTADLAAVAKSGLYGDLKNAPALKTVATSGLYSDLTGAPALKNVAFTGAYADLNGAPDLTPFAKTADLSAYTKTAALKAVATSGAYADLSGAPPLGTGCGTGLVIRGFKADGAYDCVAAFDISLLPPDALAKVSNGMLTDQIADFVSSTAVPVKIPDNSPPGVVDAITWPDYGTAQSLTVTVDITNSDVSTLKLLLTAPDATQYTLYDATVAVAGVSLKKIWTDKSTLVTGSLATWVGKNPKGIWKLTVIDGAFLANGTDGQVNAWSLAVQTLSEKKVKALGGVQFFNANSHPVVCNASQFGFTYANPADKSLYVCNGKEFYAIQLAPAGTQDNPATSCKEILTKQPASESGLYWLKSGGTFQAYCNMTDHGGGWTLVLTAGIGFDLTKADLTGQIGGVPTSPSQPATGKAFKLSDAQINAIRTNAGSAAGYWVTTPGSGTGKYGAEIFHRSDCSFKLQQSQSQTQSTTCHQWTVDYNSSPTWKNGQHWNANDTAGYGWAFGYANTGVCYQDGRDLGAHEVTLAPFHRGWCNTQAWGLVYVR